MNISWVWSPELSSSVVGKVELTSAEADIFSV